MNRNIFVGAQKHLGQRSARPPKALYFFDQAHMVGPHVGEQTTHTQIGQPL